jgi:hypothetical protein
MIENLQVGDILLYKAQKRVLRITGIIECIESKYLVDYELEEIPYKSVTYSLHQIYKKEWTKLDKLGLLLYE